LINSTFLNSLTSKTEQHCCNSSPDSLCRAALLDELELAKFSSIIEKSVLLPAGELISKQSDKFEYIFAIKTGSCKTYTTDHLGNEQITGFYFPGDVLGLSSIDSGILSMSAKTLETSTFCKVPFRKIDDLSSEIPKLRRLIFKIMSKEISYEQDMQTVLATKNSEQRIAFYLLKLSKNFKTRGFSELRFRLSMSRNDIGSYLGLTVETVSRTLSKLHKDNYLKVNKREIEIVKMENLISLAG
jgi:CRP/FNR family transcriptional regulator